MFTEDFLSVNNPCAYVRVRIKGQEMFVFWKIWCALLSCYLRFEIHPFALLRTRATPTTML